MHIKRFPIKFWESTNRLKVILKKALRGGGGGGTPLPCQKWLARSDFNEILRIKLRF